MGALDLTNVMDALAAQVILGNVVDRAYGWPVENIQVPSAVVGYPTDTTFDVTFARGSDRAVFPLYVFVGKSHERAARDKLSSLITGLTGIKESIDGNLGGACQTARVTDMAIQEVTVAAVPYLAAVFSVEVYS